MSISQITSQAPALKLSDSAKKNVSKNYNFEIGYDNKSGHLAYCTDIYGNLALSSDQVKNVYTGLKQGEEYKKRYADALQVVDSLNAIVENQDYNLNLMVDTMKQHDEELKQLYDERQKIAVENKPVPWYKNPWVYGSVGLVLGILVAK